MPSVTQLQATELEATIVTTTEIERLSPEDRFHREGLRSKFDRMMWILAGTAVLMLAVALSLAFAPGTAWAGAFSLRGSGVALSAGALGSAIAGLLSAANRRAAGWELSDGTKWPPRDENGDAGNGEETANANMIPLFLIRPALGAIVSWSVYAGITGGKLPGTLKSAATIVFVAVLVGFFAKTVLDVLKSGVKGLVGRS